MKRTNKKGFTIVELVVVIAVIAILAAVMIPTFSGITGKARESAVLQDAKNAYTEIYAADISDGDLDGDYSKALDYTKPTEVTTYTVNDGAVTFVYDGDGYNATFSNNAWTMSKDQ